MVELYGLYDPDSGVLRYIGKARDHQARFKTHLSDSRRAKRPVCNWIKSLTDAGKLPTVSVLETVEDEQWQAAEIRLIAEHRKTSNLLNLADGGDRPSQTKEQRANASRAAYKASVRTPELAAVNRVKKDAGRHLARLMKQKDFSGAYTMRLIMKANAAHRPDIYGCWANL